MTFEEYKTAALATINPALSDRDKLINAAMGLAGESGEAIDLVKKWLYVGHEFDTQHFIRELGDIAWYLAEAVDALHIPLESIFQANLDKLAKRYPNGFSLDASVHRQTDDI